LSKPATTASTDASGSGIATALPDRAPRARRGPERPAHPDLRVIRTVLGVYDRRCAERRAVEQPFVLVHTVTVSASWNSLARVPATHTGKYTYSWTVPAGTSTAPVDSIMIQTEGYSPLTEVFKPCPGTLSGTDLYCAA
jgi:hypothetical protein